MDAQLDNPIWHALTTEQTQFAERDGDAARFVPAATQLAGLRVLDDASLAALARLFRPGEIAMHDGVEVPTRQQRRWNAIHTRHRAIRGVHRDGTARRGLERDLAPVNT